ncbi:hypothetical protein ACLMJK_007400 [Lecanora helva]
MSSVGHHLVRRALDVSSQAQAHFSSLQEIDVASKSQEDHDIHPRNLALLCIGAIWVTIIAFMAMMSAISYTYGDVIGTLAMIETPTAAAFEVESTEASEEVDAPLLSDEQKTEKKKTVESSLYIVKQKPITAKMRTAVKHLKAQGGRLARFRGLHVLVIYGTIHSLIVNLLAPRAGHSLARPIVAVIASIAMCRLHMTWTHIVISAPSTKHWWQRIPPVKAAKNIIVPTAIYAIAAESAIYIPSRLFATAHRTLWEKYSEDPSRHSEGIKVAIATFIGIVLIALSIVLLVVVPANVSLKRIEASMLPEEHEAIVPFDRTFAGKVKPEILGGSGAVGMLDAWKTFDRSARLRLLKLYAKILAIQFVCLVSFVCLVRAELAFFIGDNVGELGKVVQSGFKI